MIQSEIRKMWGKNTHTIPVVNGAHRPQQTHRPNPRKHRPDSGSENQSTENSLHIKTYFVSEIEPQSLNFVVP